jgi:hypothetical protein
MQEPRFNELEQRASNVGLLDSLKKLETETRVREVIEEMKSEDKVLTLSDEEENMLRSFRNFKLRMRKHGEVFTWQTRMPESVQLAGETGFITHPQEVVTKA